MTQEANNKDTLVPYVISAERLRILNILDGIDRTEEENGWWETSDGAEFGKNILAKIKGEQCKE